MLGAQETGVTAVPPPAPRSVRDPRLARLLSDHFQFIWRYVRRLGVPDPDDATQQVFIILANKLEGVEPDRERAFLAATAVRVAANARRLRDRRREQASDSALAESPHPGPTPEELVDHKRKRELLDAVLDILPLPLRTVFVLYEMEGMSTAEIARMLDIPMGTAASRLRRARELFQGEVARLRERGESGGKS
ncbi:MAG: sigma-70 family RNA polymerase sigma factor [Polyangiaceae bacterium]